MHQILENHKNSKKLFTKKLMSVDQSNFYASILSICLLTISNAKLVAFIDKMLFEFELAYR